jgi:methyl-accepting chemotaxis protein
MSLRLKLILVSSSAVLILFGVSEWLSYLHTSALLDRHEAILIETTDHAVALEKLRETRSSMFLSVTTTRVLNALVTLILSVGVLNYVWYRVIYRPISRLLAQINIMGRGTWQSALPVNRNDEIGQLTTAFNELGEKLTSTFRHINTSSRLSALAFIGHRLMRQVNVARGQVLAAKGILLVRQADGLELAVATLDAVEANLGRLEGEFQKDFDREVAEDRQTAATKEG